MKIATLLEIDCCEDRAHCGACHELFSTNPVQCLRFEADHKCIELQRDPETRRPIRCDDCLAAESAMLRALDPIADAVNLLEIVEGGAQLGIPGHVSFDVRDEDRNRMLDFVKRWRRGA